MKTLNELVDWSIFLPDFSLLPENQNKGTGGGQPCSSLPKFKMLILQPLYNLSDDALEQQPIRDYDATPASLHDSQVVQGILTANSDLSLFADSAYMLALSWL